MKKYLLFLFFLTLSFTVFSQPNDEKNIRAILAKQTAAWNEGNIEAFMNGYWKNDSLLFVGSGGVTYGYDKTLNNYKKNYPDANAMGKLTFDLLQVKRMSPNQFFVLGKWMLKRTIGDLSGHFTLVFKKINGKWVIISDHSS